MSRFIASIRKEIIILLSDKLGLAVMFMMPLLLVFIITIIQDSAYKIVNENKVSIIISNQDAGKRGDQLIHLLDSSGFFVLEQNNSLDPNELEDKLINDDILTALYIPKDFTASLKNKSEQVSSRMMSELGLLEYHEQKIPDMPNIELYIDPVLQKGFSESISRMLSSYLGIIENKLMIESIYDLMGQEMNEHSIVEQLVNNRIKIDTHVASHSDNEILPNSSQHNVPAWTLFAMFFMVVSLGANVVRERVSGSFMRLKTMPTSFAMVLTGKLLVYVFVAILQIGLIFGISILSFPFLDLPVLVLPESTGAFLTVVLFSSIAAVSYALMIGTISKTLEQCIGVGAVSVIIFGAIGGIWVPTFVMPDYMKTLAMVSPLHWCLEGFYILFLKGGSWQQLFPVITYIFFFILTCQLITLVRLRSEKLL